MTTLFGVLLLVGGFTVLAVVRPWQSEGRDRREADPPVNGGSPPSRPRPGPRRGTAVTEAAAVSGGGTAGGGTAAGRAATAADAARTRGSASVGGGAARRPRPVRGLGAASPAGPVDETAREAVTSMIPRVAPAPTASAAARTRVFEAPVVEAAVAEAPVVDGPSGGRAGPTGVPSPVVPLKPRPAARRAEPRSDRVPVRHHRVESIQRGRLVSTDPGETEIVLPEWLGPMSVPDSDAAPVRAARHAG